MYLALPNMFLDMYTTKDYNFNETECCNPISFYFS